MGGDGLVQSVALFYLYAFLDEKLAVIATVKTLRRCDQLIKKSPNKENFDSILVQATQFYWNKFHKKNKDLSGAIQVRLDHFNIPKRLDLGAWQQFRKQSDTNEFLAVLWSRVLKISDDKLALGLEVSEGTVRHRVSRGIRGLARMRRVGKFHV